MTSEGAISHNSPTLKRRFTDLTPSEKIIVTRLGRLLSDSPEKVVGPVSELLGELNTAVANHQVASISDQSLEDIVSGFQLVGVVNPRVFLDEFQLELRVYIVKVRDALSIFWEAFGGERPEIRDIYQVFGYHDVVITSLGTVADFDSLEGSFARSGFDYIRLTVSESLRFRGYDTPKVSLPDNGLQSELQFAANTAAIDYRKALAQPGISPLLKRLETFKIILGPSVLEDVQLTGRARAWVAIKFSGSVSRREREAFFQSLSTLPTLGPCLRSIFRLQVEESDNFACLLELSCDTFGELDIATDDLIYAGPRLETLTLPITKPLERGWRLSSSDSTTISPGFARVWAKLNREQKRRLAEASFPKVLATFLDDTLKTVYEQHDLVDASNTMVHRLGNLAPHFARALLDSDSNGLLSVRSQAVILVEQTLRALVERIAREAYSGPTGRMASELGLAPDKEDWGYCETLLDKWLTTVGHEQLEDWQKLVPTIDNLRAARNRQFHGLDSSDEISLRRLCFDVGGILEDSARVIRWLVSLNLSRGSSAPSYASRPLAKLRVFISYRSPHRLCADRIYAALTGRSYAHLFDVFIDSVDLKPGPLIDQLEYHLQRCDRFLPLLTEDYFEGLITIREAEMAIRLAVFRHDVGIVPLVLEGKPEDYPSFLTGYVSKELDCSATDSEFIARIDEVVRFLLRDPFVKVAP